jgi:hypothetical protein
VYSSFWITLYSTSYGLFRPTAPLVRSHIFLCFLAFDCNVLTSLQQDDSESNSQLLVHITVLNVAFITVQTFFYIISALLAKRSSVPLVWQLLTQSVLQLAMFQITANNFSLSMVFGLFNDAFSSSDYEASNDGMINEQWMVNDMEGSSLGRM